MLKIIEKAGPWGILKRKLEVPIIDGGKLWDYFPEWIRRIEVVSIVLNGEAKHDEEFMSVEPVDGDVLELAPYHGIIGFIFSVALQLFSWGLKQNEQANLGTNRLHARIGKSYQFDVMQLQTSEGNPIAVIDGEMRTAGQLLQVFSDQFTEGRDRVNMVIGHCEGPVEAVNPNGLVDVHVDGNLIGNYRFSEYATRTGTLNDTPAQGFDKASTTSAVSLQLSRGSSVILAGTGAAEFFRLKVQFISGCYTIDNDGHYHGALFVCRLRFQLLL